MLTDGRGRAARGPVAAVGRDWVDVEVADQIVQPAPRLRFAVVQALAKGDRGELAAELLTEIGVSAIWPWQASRSIVRWDRDGDGDKAEQGAAEVADPGAGGHEAVPTALGTGGRRSARSWTRC